MEGRILKFYLEINLQPQIPRFFLFCCYVYSYDSFGYRIIFKLWYSFNKCDLFYQKIKITFICSSHFYVQNQSFFLMFLFWWNLKDKIETCYRERGRNVVTHKASHSHSSEDTSAEAIRHFHVSNYKMPSIFQLLRVKGLPPWANTSCVSIDDVIQVTTMIFWLQVTIFLLYSLEMIFLWLDF